MPHKMDRQQAFSRMKDSDQGTTAFLQDVAAVFGKPSAIAIRFRDGERYDGGTWMAAQDYADFKARCPAPLYQRQRRWRRDYKKAGR